MKYFWKFVFALVVVFNWTLSQAGVVPFAFWKTSVAFDCYTGSPPIGSVCAGGTIYAGTFNGHTYMTTPGGCEYEPSGTTTSSPGSDFTPSCSGTDTMTKYWNDGGTNPYFDIPGVENIAANATPSTVLGDVNTDAIVAITNPAEGGLHAAARYCDRNAFGGFTDWYLPSKSELAYIFCKSRTSGSASYPNEDPNCATYGFASGSDVLPGFASTLSYHSSTEYSTGGGHNFKSASTTGQQSNSAKNIALFVRCVRQIRPAFVASLASPESYVSNLNVTGLDADYTGSPQVVSQTIVIKNIGDMIASGFTVSLPSSFEQVGGTCMTAVPLLVASTCTMEIQAKVSGIIYNGAFSQALTISDSTTGRSMNVQLSGTASNFPDPCDGVGVAIGTQCDGGAIYAGQFDSGKYMTTPGGCSYEPSGTTTSYSATDFTPTCSGTDSITKAWRGAANNYDIPGAENVTVVTTKSSSSYRGDVNTAAIAAITNSAEGGYHPAARYCDKLDYGGYQDWYLPSKSELAHLYCKTRTSGSVSYPNEDANCATYGYATGTEVVPGFRTTASYYWASTETSSSAATTIKASDGTQTVTGAKSTAYYIRCVRRY
ncbi:DUF1566 domain-containing protein [Bdellovibrio sp. HCB337]|uniref:Lcl domain-containing protein n=1 Tax=Bdellovibrio sp. HCB337 TaxID=3394358 RepID=UPI0039A63C80